MRLLKLSGLFLGLGAFFYGLAYISAGQLDESKAYSFPESLGRHYAKATGQFPSFDAPVEFRQSIDFTSDTEGTNIDTIEIETTAVDIKLVQATPEAPSSLGIELRSRKVSPEDPLLTDTSVARTLRVITNESDRPASGARSRSWTNFSFGDFDDENPEPKMQTGLVLRIPPGVKNVVLRTVAGDVEVNVSLDNLKFQTKSGDLNIKNSVDQPIAMNEISFETVSGDFSSDAAFSKLFFNSVSGDVHLSTMAPKTSVDGKSVSGDLKIALQNLDATVDFDSKSGVIEFDEEALKLLGLKSVPEKNTPFKVGQGSSQIIFRTISGSLKVE